MGNDSKNIKRQETARPDNRVGEGKEVNPSKKVIAVVKRGGEYERRTLCHDGDPAARLPSRHGSLVVTVRTSSILVPPFFSGFSCFPVGAGVKDVLYVYTSLFRRFFCGRISCYISVFIRVKHHAFRTSITPFQIRVMIVVYVSILMTDIGISVRIFNKSVRRDLRDSSVIKPSIGSVQRDSVPFSRLQISLASYGPDFSSLVNFVFAKAWYAFSFHLFSTLHSRFLSS